MPDDIAGYIDRSYVKGLAYKYAAGPIPTVFTGNINEVSDDLLVKAMYVVNDGSATGDFPTVGGQYLLNTIRYGNDYYLQTAVTISSDNIIEYSRIYSNGSWTKWVTSNPGDTKSQVNTLSGSVDEIYVKGKDGNPSTGMLVDLTSRVTTLDKENGRVARVESAASMNASGIDSLNGKLSNKIQQIVISQNVSMRTAGEVNGYFQLGTELNYPANGVLIGMTVNTSLIGQIAGTVYMLSYSANGTKPYINYQKGSGVTFSNVPHDFIFTFYVP
jgi:hypothetical protein